MGVIVVDIKIIFDVNNIYIGFYEGEFVEDVSGFVDVFFDNGKRWYL